MEITPNSTQPATSNTPSSLGNVQRPGQYLRQTRITQNLELSSVATALNMSLKTLTALENDDYAALPEVAFIKGYYRSYAKFLKVDASSIIQRFDEIYATDTGVLPNYALNNSPIKMMGKLSTGKAASKRKWILRSVWLVLFCAIVALMIAVASQWSAQPEKKVAAPVTPSTAANNNNVEILSLNDANSPTGDSLSLSFTKPSDVRIVDATGKVLLTGRQEANVTVYGETPFQIRLVQPQNVSLTLNQEPISLSPYMGKNVAEFRLSR